MIPFGADLTWEIALADPFLRSHQVGPRMFEIGQGLTPVSIRDQMLRGAIAVDRAHEHRLIGPNDPLLVVGGGIAGAATAARAARYSVPTVLVESQPYLFSRQNMCATRWVSPTQYDWPAPHFANGSYPWDPPSAENVELVWNAAFGEELAMQWSIALQACRRLFGGPQILTGRTFIGASFLQTRVGLRIQAQIKPLPDAPLNPFALLIFATGLGDEGCAISGHLGPAFWGTDTFEQPRLGISSHTGRKPRVLISGAGDGALQDFIRLMTGKRSAVEVYNTFPFTRLQKNRLEKAVTWEEDHWQRAALWSTRAWDCQLLKNLHATYHARISELPQTFWQQLKKQESLFRVPREIEVTLIHPCIHFGKCYALNHIVVLILCKHLTQEGHDIIKDKRRITRITSRECKAPKTASDCFNKEHSAFSKPAQCGKQPPKTTENKEGTFNTLVLRGGLKRLPGSQNARSIIENRQLLPTYMPWPPGLDPDT